MKRTSISLPDELTQAVEREAIRTDVVVTLDRRHFGAVQPRHVAALRLLPD